eukprot:TRINITY_DN458_c0_g3_i2.p1 TRINITY_DN458_c0_g3~~TRINITY_DN458_c0_g3_i2.p1  ORF type:complete len:146 (-),score=19.16 TRINITY_DN458_c0_g3_i2:103-540(-)
MAALDKALLAKARKLASAADRMAELAMAPETDPAYINEARRQENCRRAQLENERRMQDQQWKRNIKDMRSEEVRMTNIRRRQQENEHRALHNSVREMAQSVQRQLQTDPIVRRARADAERQQRLVGSGQAALASSGPSLQNSNMN